MRRTLVSVCLLLAIALPCQAQGDKAKPNTLTPKEIADGWILLFDGETTFGWEVTSPATGKSLKAADGALNLGDLGAAEVLSTVYFGSFDLYFEYQCDTDHTLFGVFAERPGVTGFQSQRLLKKAAWTGVRISMKEKKLRIDVPDTDPDTKFAHTWAEPCVFRLNQGKDTVTKLRNIKLRPLETKPLFSGKDLTGWKEFLGKKSKFTVIDGAITVTNGPGDLQTVGKYQDFVLQLECKSNGKHLNSGIFFRCKDNEYQNGYEAQIFNKFTPEATQDYTIEEYDPKTNKLLAKNKIKATAVDFGTGAIYRRVPARKEMSKDGEWFGMTIVAHGNHLATWVNGVQVVDWHDNRPKSDNPRTGYRAEAGHISIQGHDPTTNLSFRNLRIAELPTGK